jgi:hypothetical protein
MLRLIFLLSLPYPFRLGKASLVTPRNITFNSLQPPPPWPLSPTGASLVLTSTCCGYGPYTPEAVSAASARFGLFDVPCIEDAAFGVPILAEWGYEWLNNQDHIFPICGNLTEAAYAHPPASRQEALARMALYFECRALDARGPTLPVSTPLVSEIGHYLLAGQSVALGTAFQVIPGSEIGENINSINLHLAASRGAARPQNTSFLIDFSSWFQGFVADFSAQRFWGPASSPMGGHSPSLHRRALFSAYFAGVGAYVAEAGAVNYFLAAASNGSLLALSPLGEVGREFFAFTHGATAVARGAPYVPLAFASAPTSGLGLGFFYSGRSWDTFPLSEAEQRLQLQLQAQWPGSLTVERQIGTPASESGYMVAGREGVDFVVLPGNHTPQTLAGAYRAVLFTGAGRVDTPQAAALLQGYVEAGGCAVVAAEDVVPALQAGWLPREFFGLEFSGPPPPAAPQNVSGVVDVETGWVGSCSPGGGGEDGALPFCAPQSSGAPPAAAWYIKTGGNSSARVGWDPSRGDKCCSLSPSTCQWFTTLAQCQAALPHALAGGCRACACGGLGGGGDVGCPAWSTSGSAAGAAPLGAYTPAQLLGGSGARALLEFSPGGTPPGGGGVLGAAVSGWGGSGGRVVTLLAPSPTLDAPLGITAHVLDRLFNDTLPFYLTSNASGDAGGVGGVQTLFNAVQQGGWVVTLVNNNGVVKQPNGSAVEDAFAGRRVTLWVPGGEGGGGGGGRPTGGHCRVWAPSTGGAVPPKI